MLIMLAMVTLITVLVMSLLLATHYERIASNQALSRVQAEALADSTADLVMERMREVIAMGSQFGAKYYTTWASEPGRLHVFTIDQTNGAITREAYDLFSALPGADDPQTPELHNVDLNKPNLAEEHPITGSRPGTMKVGWINLLRDPSQAASAANPIVGRVAYWVDDESCKVNVNTADGSQRGATPEEMAADKKYSYGFGTPSEISLAALPGMNAAKADAIAAKAWTNEFNSLEELTQTRDSLGNGVMSKEEVEAIRFDTTFYNSSPDVNFMGEPRINLIQTTAATATLARQASLFGSGPTTLDFIYPQPSQLISPAYLPVGKYYLHTLMTTSQKINHTGAVPEEYYIGRMFTNLLMGQNLRGQNFTWPKFTGADTNGFAGKYTPRQLDSIVLQMLDVTGKIPYCSYGRAYTMPSVLEEGWLSKQPIVGVSRAPRITEVVVQASSTWGDPLGYGAKITNSSYKYPLLRVNICMEFYTAKGAAGVPHNPPYDGGSTQQWRYFTGGGSRQSGPNFFDLPVITTNGTAVTGPGRTGTAWSDVLLQALDQNGDPAGVDFAGSPSDQLDPDQIKAALYHPYAVGFSSNQPTGIYRGSAPAGRTWGVLETLNGVGGAVATVPGGYISRGSRYSTTDHPAKPTATSIRLVGGLQVWLRNESAPSGYNVTIMSPFNCLVRAQQGATMTPELLDELKQCVIPVDLTVPALSPPVKSLARVADPMVNQLPGDWELVMNPAPEDITLTIGGNPNVYMTGGQSALDPYFELDSSITYLPANKNGDNPGFRPPTGDPLSIWQPSQDPRLPRLARFPSVGALFSIRTGMFPDFIGDALPMAQQKGVPFRSINLSPSTQFSQKTAGGTSYPDWAMLDLFTVPFIPQKPAASGQPSARRLTAGGATIGRLNINNPLIPYPFSEGGPNNDPPKRNTLQALFFGLTPSTSYDSGGTPIYTTLGATESAALAQAVTDYQRDNGPFFMAGQIANVPAIASYLYTGVAPESISRNDVVRDTVGAITTRSNVFSIWVVAQVVKKRRDNLNYGDFEAGDTITGEVRRHYLMERFLEVGRDSVPGNAVAPSVAATPNAYSFGRPAGELPTSTPPQAQYHPPFNYPLPYRWRIRALENSRL